MGAQLGGELRLQSAGQEAEIVAQSDERGLQRRVQVEVAEALGRRRYGAASETVGRERQVARTQVSERREDEGLCAIRIPTNPPQF